MESSKEAFLQKRYEEEEASKKKKKNSWYEFLLSSHHAPSIPCRGSRPSAICTHTLSHCCWSSSGSLWDRRYSCQSNGHIVSLLVSPVHEVAQEYGEGAEAFPYVFGIGVDEGVVEMMPNYVYATTYGGSSQRE